VAEVKGRVYGGFSGLPSGMNSGIDASLLKDTEFARGINLSTRGGFAETRGGFSLEATLPGTGVFRGAEVWRLNSGDMIAYIRGSDAHVYHLDTGESWTISGLFVDAGFVAGTAWCYLCQADRWMVIQNGIERPVVLQYEGGVASLYGRDPDLVALTVGTIGYYLHKRIHYVPIKVPSLDPSYTDYPTATPTLTDEDGRACFVSSDVRLDLTPESLFMMTEHRVVNEGGAIALPAEMGFIEGFGQMRGLSSTTGPGSLIVFGREGVAAFDVALPRTSWLTTVIGQALFLGAGTRSSRSIASVNDDLVYIDTRGDVRFVQYDRASLSGGSGALYNTPKSNEMRYFIRAADPLYLSEASSAFTDNRFYWTLHGESDHTYRGLGVLDMIPTYSMSAKDPAAYYGIWTGFDFHQILAARKNQDRLFFAVAKTDSGLALLKYSDDQVTDEGTTPITATVETGALNLATEGSAVATDVKRLQFIELWLGNIKRNTTVSVYYKPFGYSKWSLAGTQSISVPGGPAQRREALKFPIKEEEIEYHAMTGQRLNVAESFQVMLRWTGFCRIDLCRLMGVVVPQPEPDSCDVDNAEAIQYPAEVLDTDFDYEVPLL
jgi:hypothetical protein